MIRIKGTLCRAKLQSRTHANHGIGESDFSILRIPNKDCSVVKTLGPNPSSSTVYFFVVLGELFCQMKVARKMVRVEREMKACKKKNAHRGHILPQCYLCPKKVTSFKPFAVGRFRGRYYLVTSIPLCQSCENHLRLLVE